jgi:uncharacterized protein (DUF1501 family)
LYRLPAWLLFTLACLKLGGSIMLNLFGKGTSLCDGTTRRDFLRIGALGLGGLTLADLVRPQAQGAADPQRSHKAAIMIFLSGGPSHLDTYDMKPNAPAEFRGEFDQIRTNVPGIEICEHMPRQAQMADKLAILRGVRTVGNHTGNEFFSGFAFEEGKPLRADNQQRPAVGSVVSRLWGSRNSMPPYVSLHDNETWEHPYYLGGGHQPFRTHSRERQNTGLENLRLSAGVSRERLEDRRAMLGAFDNVRRDIDVSGITANLDANTARALEIVTSSHVRDAFDLSKESAQVKAAYGTAPAAFNFVPGMEFLLARRLVEAGVRVVSLAIHGWDTHEKNFETLRRQLPIMDQAFTALITDLEMRGMLDDVAIIMGGEMGRTPRITRERAGRDHWNQTGITVMAGGGFKTGQIVGASDARGEQVLGRAITPQMMTSTIYRSLGIDPSLTFPAATGRPMYILDETAPIQELL